jgi:hypothetical protein
MQMQPLPWNVSARGDYEPYVAPESNERTVIVPPWAVQERLNVEEQTQKEQGHGWHGYFEDQDNPGASKDSDSATGNTPAQDSTIAFLNANPMGFTLNNDGTSPQTGFNVGGVVAPLFVDPANPKTDAAIEKYVAANQSLLSQPNMQLGGWLGDDGRYVVEVSQNYSDGKEAAQAAMDRNQNSYWDNAQGILNNAEAAVRSPDPSQPAVDANGKYQDGTVQTPALQQSYGTGDFGVTNPNTDAGVKALVGPNGEGVIPASNFGRDDAGSLATATEPAISDKFMAKMEGEAEFYKFPDEQGRADEVEKYLDRMSSQQYVLSQTFYPRANNESTKIEGETGGVVSAYQAAGMIAALSPNTPVGSNIAGAHIVAQLVATQAILHFDPQVLKDYNSGLTRQTPTSPNPSPFNIQNDKSILDQPSRNDAGAAVLLYTKINQIKEPSEWAEPDKVDNSTENNPVTLMSGTNGIGKAIDIAAGVKYGTDELATPNNTLGGTGGMKERDFFNNIIDPTNQSYQTIDGFMVGIIQGSGSYTQPAITHATTKFPEGRTVQLYQAAIGSGVQSMADGVKAGIYPLMVDAVRKGTDQYNASHGTNLTYVHGQAGSWAVVHDESNTTPQSAGNFSANMAAPGRGASDSEKLDAMLANEVPLLPVVSGKDALDAFRQQYPDLTLGKTIGMGITIPDPHVYGVKCADGTMAFAVADKEMSQLQSAGGNINKATATPPGLGLPDRTLDSVGMALPSDKDIQIALSTVADLHDRFPLTAPTQSPYKGQGTIFDVKPDNAGAAMTAPIVILRGPDGVLTDTNLDPVRSGLEGYTTPSMPDRIQVNAAAMSTDVTHQGSLEGWHMPVSTTVPIAQYMITHEYGHLVEFTTQNTPASNQPPAAVVSAWHAANRGAPRGVERGGLSTYGATNNAHEGFAEAWTEWTISGGQTDNAAAKGYASIFGWAGAPPREPGADMTSAISSAEGNPN